MDGLDNRSRASRVEDFARDFAEPQGPPAWLGACILALILFGGIVAFCVFA